jgi:hypothetical protein
MVTMAEVAEPILVAPVVEVALVVAEIVGSQTLAARS